MNFQTLQKVENAQHYLDKAFKAGRDAASRAILTTRKQKTWNRYQKLKTKELKRLDAMTNSIASSLISILKAFPTLDHLPKFYNELVKASIDFYAMKKSLAALNWARGRIYELAGMYRGKLKTANSTAALEKGVGEYIGRLSSIIYQVEKNLEFLEACRKEMKAFPTVKTSLKTVVITGFPNVGKTTLLYKLTGSKPEIAGYAFTTTKINVSYYKLGGDKIQVIDTPGTLDRFQKMNPIEKQAFLALRYCADLIVYVFDLTESYPLQMQKKLYENVRGMGMPVAIYYSKADILGNEKINSFMAQGYPGFPDVNALKKHIEAEAKKLNKDSTDEPEE